MAAVDKTMLVLRFPEFSDVDSARVDALNADVDCYVNDDFFETCLELARVYMMAHLLSLTGNGPDAGGAGGTVRMEKVGDLERQYQTSNTVPGTSDWLNLTTYGQRYMGLVRTIRPDMIGFSC